MIEITSPKLGYIAYPFFRDTLSFRIATREMARLLKRELKKQFPGRKPVLVFRGTSGTAYATEVGRILEERGVGVHYLQIARKNNRSHRDGVERSCALDWAREDNIYIFIDDFICTGATYKEVSDMLREFSSNAIEVVCVGSDVDISILDGDVKLLICGF